jgi:phosphatidylinositol alpha-mannosyltransferase
LINHHHPHLLAASPSVVLGSNPAKTLRQLRIAMISYYLPSGSKIGVGFQAHYMANAMARRGHHVTMFSPCSPCDDAEYNHQTIDVGRHLRTFYFAWQFRHIDFSKFDVLHAHGDDYWLWRRRVPCHVKTMHGSCLEEARKVAGFKEKARMLGLAAGEIIGSLVADRCIAVSQNTTHSYRWIDAVIPNGVDLGSFTPGLAPKESRPTILFVGTYRNRKRGQLLMEVFQREIRPAIPDAQLWMVCNDAPEAPGVTVMGAVPTGELISLYQRAWVFCLPSSYEGFGVPYIEAMACGTPVVATPNPGANEVLDDGKYGVIATPGQLGRSIVDLLKNSASRAAWSNLGMNRAADYSWDTVLGQYEKVYESIRKCVMAH